MNRPRGTLRAWLATMIAGLAQFLAPEARGADTVSGTAEPARLIEWGKRLFTAETFGGNGRVCSTCHELEQFGTITPAFVQARFASNPLDPLFRAIDSDDGQGKSYKRLLKFATIRVPIDLPTVTASGLAIRKCDEPTATRVILNRGNPSVFNMVLESHLMHDGREGADLETQAVNAVRTHNEPTRDPSPHERQAMAQFQRSLFSNARLQRYLAAGEPLTLPQGRTPAEKRGRAFFAPDRQCGQCHSGPLLNRTSEFHPNAVGFGFESSFVGREPGNPNPKFYWCYVEPRTGKLASGPYGSTRVFDYPAADPGLGLIAGVTEFHPPHKPPEFVPNELLVRLAGPTFKIPTLWGAVDTAPYFHDNSAPDLDTVLEQYNFVFSQFPDGSFGLGCDRKAAKCLSERDKTDIIAFMQLLSFDSKSARAGGEH